MEVPADWDALAGNGVGREHHLSPGRALHYDPDGPSENDYRAAHVQRLGVPVTAARIYAADDGAQPGRPSRPRTARVRPASRRCQGERKG
jgi:hypothetical protein